MRISEIPNEKRDGQGGSFWANLVGKLGLGGEMVRTASPAKPAAPSPMADGVQSHGSRSLAAGARVPVTDAVIIRTAASAPAAELRRTVMAASIPPRMAAEFFGQDKVGNTEEYARAKGAVAHARSALDMAAGSAGRDMRGHVEKMAAVEKTVDGLADREIRSVPAYSSTLAQMAESLNRYENMLREAAPAALGAPGPMGAFDSIAPQATTAAASADDEAKAIRLAQAYNSLSMAYSLAAYLSAQAEAGNVSAAVPQGLAEVARSKGHIRTAGSGDPGDADNGNTVYRDIDRCRGCVWFESDHTHSTYRDKCKHCTHATLGGTVDHFWPRAQQMVVWAPSWNPPAEERKARFQGSLSRTAGDRIEILAKEVVTRAGAPLCAGRLASAFHDVLSDPLRLAADGGKVSARVADITGIGFTLHASEAAGKSLEPGQVVIAAPMTLQDHLCDAADAMSGGPRAGGDEACAKCGFVYDQAVDYQEGMCPDCAAGKPAKIAGTMAGNIFQQAKGERQKIRTLREKLDKAEDPSEIKSLNDAIDSLEGRIDKDKASKEKRREEREKRQKERAEAAPKDPVTASAKPCCGGDGYCDACDRGADKCICASAFAGTLSLAGAKERQDKRPKDYGKAHPAKPMKALASMGRTAGAPEEKVAEDIQNFIQDKFGLDVRLDWTELNAENPSSRAQTTKVYDKTSYENEDPDRKVVGDVSFTVVDEEGYPAAGDIKFKPASGKQAGSMIGTLCLADSGRGSL